MKYIFILILIAIYFTLAFTLRLAGKPHKQVVLENTLPIEHLNHPQVLAVTKRYKKSLWLIAILFSLGSLPLFFISYDSLLMSFFWLLLISSMVTFYFCQIYFIRQMHQLIVKKQWQLPIQPFLIDTQLILQKNQKIISSWWFLPPVILWLMGSFYSLVSTTFDGAWIMVLANGLTLLISFVSWLAIARLPVRPLTNNQQINQQYNDLTKHDWSFLMLSISWILVPLLFIPVVSPMISTFMGNLLAIFLITAIIFWTGFTFWYLLSLRKKQDQLLAQVTSYRYLDDDQYWRFGFYNNPNDTRLFIPDRIGMNIGMNFGRPLGKVLTGLIGIVLVVAMIVSILPLYLYDFTANPLQMELTQAEVVLSAPFAPTSEVAISDIESVELIEEVSGKVIRTNGMATDKYATGKFTVAGKAANFYIDYQSSPILHLVTEKRDYYYTNKESGKTLTSYQELQQLLE